MPDHSSITTHRGVLFPTLAFLSLILASCGGLMGELADEVAAKRSGAYRLIYDANGADSGSAPVDATEYLGGETVLVQGAGDLVKSGFNLVGWTTVNDRESQAGTSYAAGASLVMGKADARLYAVWLPTYLTCNASGNDIAVTDCDETTAGDLSLPAGVTAIRDSAFEDCSSLTSLDLPDSVKSIGVYAFAYCSTLKSIELPKGLTSISYGLFNYCSSLTQVELPEGLTFIDEMAFSSCTRLTNLILPSTLTTIGYYLFFHDSLDSLTILAAIPPTGYSQSNYCTIDAIYVPAGSVDKYKDTFPWSDFSAVIYPIP